MSSAAPRDSERWPAIAALGFFVAVSAWLTWPLVPRMGSALATNPDTLLNFWALSWSFHILPTEPLSLFDANIFHPRSGTLAFSEHLFGITALVWPAYLFGGNAVFAYNLAVFSSFVLSGLGMYLLVREITGSSWAGVVAGLVYLAAPFRFLHLIHLQLLTYQWFPFVFWCLLRFLRHGRTRSLVGVVVFSVLQILSCSYYAVYLCFAVLVFGLVVLLAARDLVTKQKLVRSALGALAVGVVVLPFFVPYLRNREDGGFYRRYEDVVRFSATPRDYFRASTLNRAPHLNVLAVRSQTETALLPGFTALLLAAAGVFFGFRRTRNDSAGRAVWFFLIALAGSSFLLSLGPELRVGETSLTLPYRFFYRHVPGFWGMRVPARIAVLVLVAVAALAGFGARGLLDRVGHFRHAAGTLLVLVLLFEYQTYSLARMLPEAPEIPPAHRWLASEGGEGAVLILPLREGNAILEESLRMYASTAHFRPLVNGYSGWWPNDYWRLVGRLRHFPTSRILRFLQDRAPVRYVLIHYDEFSDVRRRHLENAMNRYRERMPVRFRYGSDVVYELLPESES